jgi:hypothetical protein
MNTSPSCLQQNELLVEIQLEYRTRGVADSRQIVSHNALNSIRLAKQSHYWLKPNLSLNQILPEITARGLRQKYLFLRQ